MAIKMPNWRVVLALQAIQLTGVELAVLELYAQSEEEAISLAECFIARTTAILSTTSIQDL